MTTREGQSVGKDQLAGEIEICKHRIAMARTVGWPALVESWEWTLKEKQYEHETRLVERAFEGLGNADDRV